MRPLILATAGHIDHGKTALVQALTGVDTDRLPEEKKRGITIDLGFANLLIGDLSFGVVDVPGHEGFIRNMLAGATGTDIVLLVVAADEGVMPQTREHLAILDLLGVSSGVVAITKADLASSEWLELVVDDVRELLRSTTLRAAPIVPVSARTGTGIAELRERIVEAAKQPLARLTDDLFRMPIDRVFSIHGTGTVVTGTVWSGTIRVDQPVIMRPPDSRARIRAIQVHGSAVESARAGERAALALAGADRESLTRGDVVIDSESWNDARMVVVRMRMIDETDWILEARQRVRVHLGTAEVMARAVLLDAAQLGAGDVGWVQLRLEQPVVTRAGDRVVIRSFSPMTTIGGGVVAELSARKRIRASAPEAERFDQILSGDAAAAVRGALSLRELTGADVEELAIATPFAPARVVQAVAVLGDGVIRISTRLYAAEVLQRGAADLVNAVEHLHHTNPLRPGVERAEIRHGIPKVPPPVAEYLIDSALAKGELVTVRGGIAAKGFAPILTDRQVTLKAAVLDALKGSGIAPPTVGELGRTLGDVREVQRLLRVLENEGAVRPVSPELYIEVSALLAAQERTQSVFSGKEGLSAAEFRTALPVSRKHLIPLLEYFDRAGITVRNGDLRRVVPASEKG